MKFVVIGQRISLMMFVLLLSYHSSITNGQTFSFSQPPTGPSSVCEGSDVTLLCAVALTLDNTTTVQSTVWSRNISGIVTTISTQTPIPNHRVVLNTTNRAFTDLVITNVTLEDNNAVYSCTATGTDITSGVVLNVTGIPSAENLTAVDNCTSVTVSWDITDEGPCKHLSYYVSLISLDDGVTLQSVITDDTNHTFTDVHTLIEMFDETSIETFNVSVTAVNGNAIGSSHTATADVRVSSNDLPSPIGLRTVPTICVTYFNISWNASNRVTCGNVSYEVSVFQSSIGQSMEPITRVSDIFYSNITGLNNSDPDVMVTVTASNRAGQGIVNIYVRLPPSQDPPPISDVTASTSRTPSDLSGFDIFIMWTRPVIDDPCTTLPVSVYIINTSVTFMNGSQANYASNNIMDTSGDSMSRFNVSYNDSFDEELVPNATYVFAINSDAVQLSPSTCPTPSACVSESDDDELSTGVAVASIIVVTFIITLVVTALISIIITSLYYKHHYNKKSLVRQEDDSHALTEDIKSNDPAHATTRANITMDTNPAYGTATTVKMDTNPAYATTAH